ncbi:unnamed protein product [Macrosiphum euphorbiae]|uniref:DUF4371 domain-containing protein n=1 Tax=Macrosiphum euphorbiae TaxID=13131 RepID=A0AAV0WSP1_9HEMI|nr:unnamed protein product [Macrosiphum euphorbiae]
MSEKRKFESGAKQRAKKKSQLLVAARECKTQTKLFFTPNSDTIKNIPVMKSLINEIDEINTINNKIPESNTINNEINTINNTITKLNPNNNEKTELNMKTKLDILDYPITVTTSDKAHYPKITNELLQSLVKYGACQPFEKDMTNNTFPMDPKTKRHYSSSYYFIKNSMNEITKYHWMSYSIMQNVVYCHPYWLFGDNATKQSIWVSGYSDWKHLTQSAIIHCNSKQHFRSDVALVQYFESKSIGAMISKQYSLEVKKWREILKLLFDVVLTLSGLGLAFRGHRENINDARCEVYLSILKLLAKHN